MGGAVNLRSQVAVVTSSRCSAMSRMNSAAAAAKSRHDGVRARHLLQSGCSRTSKTGSDDTTGGRTRLKLLQTPAFTSTGTAPVFAPSSPARPAPREPQWRAKKKCKRGSEIKSVPVHVRFRHRLHWDVRHALQLAALPQESAMRSMRLISERHSGCGRRRRSASHVDTAICTKIDVDLARDGLRWNCERPRIRVTGQT